MRFCVFFVVLSLSCSEKSEEAEQASPPAPSNPSAPAETPPKAPQGEKATGVPMDCDGWNVAGLVQQICKTEIDLAAPEIFPDDDMACRRAGRAGGVNLQVMIGNAKLNGYKGNSPTYPPEPLSAEKKGKRKTRMGAFPYTITIEQQGGETCTPDQAEKLAKAIAARLPQQEGQDTSANEACDALLSSRHLQASCGGPGELRATAMEDGQSVYCNRVGPGGLVFIVSRHGTTEQAKSAEKVARGTEHSAVAAKGRFLVELKTRPPDRNPLCSDEDLEGLLSGVLSRLGGGADAP